MSPTGQAKYRAQTAAEMVGVSLGTLRAWRNRYAPLTERVRPTGAYSEAEVARLRLIRMLSEQGHSLEAIAHASSAELGRALSVHESSIRDAPIRSAGALRTEVVKAIRALEVGRAERLLSLAALDVEPRAFIFDLLVPIARRFGRADAPAARALTTVLLSASRSLAGVFGPSRQTLVVATPPGEPAEREALLSTVLGIACGWRSLFLGTRLPWKEIGSAAKQARADLVLVWVDSPVGLDPSSALRTLERTLAPRKLIVAGRRAPRGGPGSSLAVHALEDLELRLCSASSSG